MTALHRRLNLAGVVLPFLGFIAAKGGLTLNGV